jgi:anti-sigma regulatory factor (Ser/Thr protein kinase)
MKPDGYCARNRVHLMSIIATRRRREPPHGSRYPHPSNLKRSYPAIASSVADARRAIKRFALNAGVGRERADEICLAASEAITNAVRFAYPARDGHIHVTAWLAGGELWVLVADNGCGLHAGGDSHGLGLGLGLISQLTDGFSVVERSSGGTELRLRFAVASS